MTYLFYLLLLFISILAFGLGFVSLISAEETPRRINAGAISVPDGYKVEPYIANLSIPTTAVFDGEDLIVAESGFKDTAKPRILRISKDGTVQVLADEGLLDPVT